MAGRKKDDLAKAKEKEKILLYVKLVDEVRFGKTKKKADLAFDKIIEMLNQKIQQLVYKFKIPGMAPGDLYQEALFALRFKAIKDYDHSRSDMQDISPFDKFAALCIRRHLSTKLKASFQNKNRVLNSSISLDQDRSSKGSEDNLFLSDILAGNDPDVSSAINERDHRKRLLLSLYSKLSSLEKEVFILYCKKYSYEEIAAFINQNRLLTEDVNVKSIDNALSRVKTKAKEIYKKIDV